MEQSKEANVLIVDDNYTNVQVLSELLHDKYNLFIGSNGNEALEILNIVECDLILLDIMMPEMDGFEVCKRIKANPSTQDVSIIFITAKNQEEDIINGFSLGAVDYITKPFLSGEVLVRVENHIEAKLNRDRLEKLNKQKDKFFSIIGHDLRGPISGLITLLEFLLKSPIEASRQETMMETMYRSAKNTYERLENLLKWSRSQLEINAPEKKELSIWQILTGIQQTVNSNINAKEIELIFQVPDDIKIFADYNMITSVFYNLISNAIKFTPRGGSITVHAKPVDDNKWDFSIRDTGIGMTEKTKNELFRIDVKHNHKGTEGENGTGLGLLLCKEFLEKHGSSLMVQSEIDEGTTFFFSLSGAG